MQVSRWFRSFVSLGVRQRHLSSAAGTRWREPAHHRPAGIRFDLFTSRPGCRSFCQHNGNWWIAGGKWADGGRPFCRFGNAGATSHAVWHFCPLIQVESHWMGLMAGRFIRLFLIWWLQLNAANFCFHFIVNRWNLNWFRPDNFIRLSWCDWKTEARFSRKSFMLFFREFD